MPWYNNNDYYSYNNNNNSYNHWENNYLNQYANQYPFNLNKEIDIQVWTTGGYSVLEDCIQFKKISLEDVGYAIGDFEELMLEELKKEIETNPSNPFRTMFEEIGKELNVNLKVFIGHIELCVNFLQPIKKNLDKFTKNTIVLLIGCMGRENAASFNFMNETKVVAMAFDDYLHVYNNEIYACKLLQEQRPSMICDYEKGGTNYDELVKKYSPNTTYLDNAGMNMAKKNTESELVRCCLSKIERFRSLFLENLRKRDCVKFTKENLLRKMRAILKEDGTFDRVLLQNYPSFIFSHEDGTPCSTVENCSIHDPYVESRKIANDYNHREVLWNTYKTIQEFTTQKKDKELLAFLQNLPKEKQDIYEYEGGDGPILFLCSEWGCVESVLYILKQPRGIPLRKKSPGGYTFLEFLLIYQYVSDENLIRILAKTLELDPDFFEEEVANQSNQRDIFYYVVEQGRISVLKYLIDSTNVDLSKKIYDEERINLLFVAAYSSPWTTQESYTLIKLLLAKGVDPTHISEKDEDILTFYFEKQPPILREKILKELCWYGYSYHQNILSWIEYFSELLTKPAKEIHYKNEKMRSIPEWSNSISFVYKKGLNAYTESWELVLTNFKPILSETIRILEECRKTIFKLIKKGKREKYIPINSAKTLKSAKDNVQQMTRKIFAANRINPKYQSINQYIKTVGAKFTQSEKKAYRNRGIALLRNTGRNALERYENLENLQDEIVEEAKARNVKGGRRTRKRRS